MKGHKEIVGNWHSTVVIIVEVTIVEINKWQAQQWK
jgi:hypothetical protein